MKNCLFPGSFDPPTLGHLDLIGRLSGLFDTVYVAVLVNPKKSCMFSPGERVEMLTACCAVYGNVQVLSSEGLTADLASGLKVSALARGVRNPEDFSYEKEMAAVNAMLCPGLETVLLFAAPGLESVSSSIVRELIGFGRDVSAFVPAQVGDHISERNKKQQS